MWGSGYPHKEGTWPYAEQRMKAMFAGIPGDETALILGGNAARCYNCNLTKLQAHANRIGPKVADLNGVTESQARAYWTQWVNLPQGEMAK